MNLGPAQATSAPLGWAQEWQRFSWVAFNQAVGLCLQGCANLAMTRTPQQAMAAIHKTHARLLRHSAEAIAEATRRRRRHDAEFAQMWTKAARTSR
jgi:hypothetical protein